MNGDPHRAKAVFLEAVENHGPEGWPAFLDRACAGQPELRRRVEVLLEAHRESATAPHQTTDAVPPGGAVELPGRVIGPYKLLQQIGEGGMGTVFMAEQQRPVQRMVALKLIKPGMDSHQVIARFEAERQALALMDHPNIAKVLDAGATDTGRPYFVMELVKGVPLTKYCDERRLAPRERLELFIAVCQAVQHAHQKGIIHRDLKPSNVLVAQYDGPPVPKVIDFGIAKAAGPKLTERTLFTDFGAVVGTLEYMSPEQAELNQLDIDTRSDVYSLGVLLYELLTGTTPLERERLKAAALLEVLRAIREEEPPRPSTRLSTTDELPSIAANRGLQPRKLSGLVRGELDWVVMRALEKDRNRRYESASGLARDVERYLHDEPVQACPPSASYRLRKFVRRYRRPVAAATVLLLALVGGIAGTTWGLVEARRQRDAAETARDEEARQRQQAFEQQGRAERAEALAKERLAAVTRQQERTEEEAANARAVITFLQEDLLGQADLANQPGLGGQAGRKPNITVRELLDRAAWAIEGKFAKQPLTEATIRLTLGNTYRALGRYAEAQPHLERAVSLRTTHQGADHHDTLLSKSNLASLYVDRGRYDLAEPLYLEVVKGHTEQLGEDAPDTMASKNNLATVYSWRGKYSVAEPLLEKLVEGFSAKLGRGDPRTVACIHNLARVYGHQKKYALAEPLFKEVVATSSKWGADHPSALNCKSGLVGLYVDWKKFALAEPLCRELVKLRIAKQGASHPETLIGKYYLAEIEYGLQRNDQAEVLFNEVVDGFTALHGPTHTLTLLSKDGLANVYRSAGKYALAEPLHRQVVEVALEKLGPAHPHTQAYIADLIACYEATDQKEKAAAWRKKLAQQKSDP
jgi:serine/threonine protein kinase/tetratricopeptide (TPR) repeat protein